MIEKICKICKIKFLIYKCRENKAKVCSPKCRGVWTGIKKRENAKPRLSTQGYYFLIKPDYHRANKQGYAKIADMILEEKLGRKLKSYEIAHHINSRRADDRPENLEVMTKKNHDSLTLKERWKNWNRWSKKYNFCINCSSIERKHSRKGLCTMCQHYLERNAISLLEVKKLQKKYEHYSKNIT